MAYCKECGAYIPEGHSKCLACGYDEKNAPKQTQAYDYKYEEPKSSAGDFLREELEKQRRRQQENSRKWAEAEKARREKAGNSSYRSTDTKKYAAPANLTTNKILSALSYFGFLFVLPYIFCEKDDFAKFHAKQGMMLFIASIIADIVASIFGLGWIVTIAKIYFIYKGVSNVLNGRKEELPYIGNLI